MAEKASPSSASRFSLFVIHFNGLRESVYTARRRLYTLSDCGCALF
jgi:hypothetical protein